MPQRWKKPVGYLALIAAGILMVVLVWLLVAPSGYHTSYKTLKGETITLDSGRQFLPLAGDCTDIHWQIDRSNPLLYDGMVNVYYRACINDTYLPTLQFLDIEPWLYRGAFIFAIFTGSSEIVLLIAAAILLLVFAAWTEAFRLRIPAGAWRGIATALCLAVAALSGHYLLRTALPGYAVHETQDSAQVDIDIFPAAPFTPDGCLRVRWKVENINAIFINDQGVVGAGEEPVCALDAAFAIDIRINTREQSTWHYIYTAPLWDTEEVRLTLAACLMLLLLAGWLTRLQLPRFILSALLPGAALVCLWGILYRPVQGLKPVGSTLPLPVGTLSLLILVVYLVLHFSDVYGIAPLRGYYQRLTGWLNWNSVRAAVIESRAELQQVSESPKPWSLFSPAGLVLLIIFVAGLVCRLYYAGEYGPRILWDPYMVARDQLMAGQYRSLLYSPGYPAWLALNLVLNQTIFQTGQLQALIDIFSIFPLYYVLRQARLNQLAALTGCLAYALYPPLAWSPSVVMAEAFSPASAVWLIAAMVRASERPTWWRWAATGLLAGFITQIRPDTVIVAGFAGLWLLMQRCHFKQLLSYGLALTISFSILPGIWGGYNWMIHGQPVFSTNSGGNTIWSGLSQFPNPNYYIYSAISPSIYLTGMEKQGYDVTRWGEDLPIWSFEAVADFADSVSRAIRTHPDMMLQAVIYRWRTMLFFNNSMYTLQQPNAEFSQREKLLLRDVSLAWLHFVEHYGALFWVAGVWLARRNPVLRLVLLLPMGSALVGLGLIYYEARYVQFAYLSYLVGIIVVVSYTTALLHRMATGTAAPAPGQTGD